MHSLHIHIHVIEVQWVHVLYVCCPSRDMYTHDCTQTRRSSNSLHMHSFTKCMFFLLVTVHTVSVQAVTTSVTRDRPLSEDTDIGKIVRSEMKKFLQVYNCKYKCRGIWRCTVYYEHYCTWMDILCIHEVTYVYIIIMYATGTTPTVDDDAGH